MNDIINRELRTLEQWEAELAPIEIEALHDYGHVQPWERLSPDEVLDMIIEWNGGIATGYQVRSIISRVYGVEL